MTTPSPKSLAAVACSAAALLAFGCGGDEPTEEEFRSQANAACSEYNERLGKIDAAQSFEDVPAFLKRTEPLLDGLIDDLEEIEAPDSVSDEYQQLVQGYQDVGGTIGDVREAAEDGNREQLTEIGERAQKQSQEVERLATRLRLEQCGAN